MIMQPEYVVYDPSMDVRVPLPSSMTPLTHVPEFANANDLIEPETSAVSDPPTGVTDAVYVCALKSSTMVTS